MGRCGLFNVYGFWKDNMHMMFFCSRASIGENYDGIGFRMRKDAKLMLIEKKKSYTQVKE